MDQLSWPTPSWVLTYTGSTIYPGPFGPGSGLTRSRSPAPDDTVPGLRSCGVDQVSRLTRTRGRGAVGFTSYPGQLSTGPS